MPKNCIKFVSGFLIPSLDHEKFGNRLKWIDKSKNIFQMDWCHKGGPKWTEQEAAVFVEWDKHKGHFQPLDKAYFTKSKQRFRSLLYKLTQEGQLKKLKSDHKFIKIYCIGERKKRRRRRRKSNDLNAEYELCNEDETSTEEKDDACSDDIFRRRVSEDNTINVLEDHTYSSADNSQNNFTDVEKDQVVFGNFQEILGSTLYESSEYLEKRVLAERNDGSEHLNSAFLFALNNTNEILENILPYEDLKHETENITTSRTSAKLQEDPCLTSVHQSKPFSENVLTDVELNTYLIHQNPEFLDLSQINRDINELIKNDFAKALTSLL